MTKRQLQKLISKKIEKLHELLDKIDELRIIDPNEPDTWDDDALYNSIENLKEVIIFLEDKELKQLDEFGNPLTEPGLCSLVNDYHSDEEDDE